MQPYSCWCLRRRKQHQQKCRRKRREWKRWRVWMTAVCQQGCSSHMQTDPAYVCPTPLRAVRLIRRRSRHLLWQPALHPQRPHLGHVLTGWPLGIALMRGKCRPLSFCCCSLSLFLSHFLCFSLNMLVCCCLWVLLLLNPLMIKLFDLINCKVAVVYLQLIMISQDKSTFLIMNKNIFCFCIFLEQEDK